MQKLQFINDINYEMMMAEIIKGMTMLRRIDDLTSRSLHGKIVHHKEKKSAEIALSSMRDSKEF